MSCQGMSCQGDDGRGERSLSFAGARGTICVGKGGCGRGGGPVLWMMKVFFSLGLLSIPNRKPVGSSNLLESNGTPSGHMAPEHGRTSAPGPASGGAGGVLPNRRHGRRRRPVWPLHLPHQSHHRALSRYLLWGLLAVCGGGGDVSPGHQGLPLPPVRQGHHGALPRHGRQRELQPVRGPVTAAVPCG